MKKLLPLLLLVFCIVGCNTKTEPPTKEQSSNTSPLQWEVLLPSSGYQEIIAFQDNLLLLRTYKENTYLDVFSLETKEVTSTLEITGLVSSQNGTIQCTDSFLAYFASGTNSVIVLDSSFIEKANIPVPRTHSGLVVISSDIQSAFFCSDTGICSLDLSTGIARLLKDENDVTLTGELFDTTILACADSDGNPFFVYSSDGHSFSLPDNTEEIQTSGALFSAIVQTQWEKFRIIGKTGYDPKVFLPESDSYTLVSGLDAIVTTAYFPGCTTISAYDITSGNQIADYPTNTSKTVIGFAWHEKTASLIYLTSTVFDKYSVCSIDLQKTKTSAPGNTVTEYFTPENPDVEGIAALNQQAELLGEKYQVEVSLSPASYSEMTRGISFVDGYRTIPYQDALSRLEDALSRISMCDLSLAAKNTPDKRIHIGIFYDVLSDEFPFHSIGFWSKGNFYIALSCGSDIDEQLYHALGYFLESRINSLGNYFDCWNSLNPLDFQYYNNYLHYYDEMTEDESDYFVSTAAMVSPSEDRAELFRAAMKEENADMLDSYPLQRKLEILCDGLRLVFQLDDEITPPWEINLQ